MKSVLEALGWPDTPLTQGLLQIAAGVYGAVLKFFQWGYAKGFLKTHKLPAKVVSIGNLTWGGTGKTPLTLHLARALSERGHKVAVLTRGYGGGDEAQLLEQKLQPIPVLVGADRVKTGLRAVRDYGADVLVLDDGYQQWRVQKDLNILTVDASNPFGNEALVPKGILREPMEEAKRADFVVIKQSGVEADQLESVSNALRHLAPQAGRATALYRPSALWAWPAKTKMELDALKGKRVCTLAGIANPKFFEKTVADLGAEVFLKYRVRDHQEFAAGDLIRLMERCERNEVPYIVTTAKDEMRLPALLSESVNMGGHPTQFIVLDVELELQDESELFHRIDTLFNR